MRIYRMLIIAVGMLLGVLPVPVAAAQNAEQPSMSPPTIVAGLARSVSVQGETCAERVARARADAALADTTVTCLRRGEPRKETLSELARAGTLAIQPVPNFCGTIPVDGNWYIDITDRTRTCSIFPWSYDVIRLNDGALIGFVDFAEVSYSYTFNNRTNWNQQAQFGVLNAGGDFAGAAIRGSARCARGPCTVTSSSFPSQPLVPGAPVANAEGAFQISFPQSVVDANTEISFLVTKPNARDSNTATIAAPRVRCDFALPGMIGAGCVFDEFVPVLTYNLSGPFPELARHIRDAQSSGLPGAYGTSTVLSRLTDQGLIDANRAAACGGAPSIPQKSCDEYPFATTFQGAAIRGGPARTFSYCSFPGIPSGTGPNGYSKCMINASQNSLGGSDEGAFYLRNRVIAADPFQVAIRN